MSRHSGFQIGAFTILLIILGAGLLLWPLPGLGANFNLSSGVVLAVQPESPADNAGLLVGDRVTRIYGYPWLEVNTRLLLLPLPWREGTPTPMTIERGGVVQELVVRTSAPTLSLQFEKVVRSLIALVCWVTGFMLGTSPRAANHGLRWTGWFWVLLGGTLSVYPLTQITSYVLTVGVLWFQCTVLAPVAVAVHYWYPPRPTSLSAQRRALWLLISAIGLGQFIALRTMFVAPATTVLYEQLLDVVRVVFLVTFGLSALLLFHSYVTTQIAHIRRQIRLIGAACVFACAWALLLLLLRWAGPSFERLVPPAAFPLGGMIIPLAYLAGGVDVDLMRLDHVVRRILLHTLTTLSTVALLVIASRSELFVVTPALITVAVLLLYGPLYGFIQRRLAPLRGEATRERALREAAGLMRSSLESTYLIAALHSGLLKAFLSPPLAIYHRANPESDTLTRAVAHGIDVPATFDAQLLGRWQQRGTVIVKAVQVQHIFRHQQPGATAAALVFHPTVALWGVIRDQHRKLLGVVLLGPRGDNDPYQAADLWDLEQFLGTAALALTNSASYTAQVEARAELRELRAHAEQIEEQTRADIAEGIHDNVLSNQLRLNREHLMLLQRDIVDPELQERLGDVAAGEESIGETLRLVCAQLKPSGQTDPLGLVLSLRKEAKWTRASWRVPVPVEVENDPVPLTGEMNRALVKIAREALNNAVAHARPSNITVRVRYPCDVSEPLVLSIANDGPRLLEPIEPKRNHWGVRNMREYADAHGATIRWERPESGGVIVIVEVPPSVLTRVVPKARELIEHTRGANQDGEELSGGMTRAVGEPYSPHLKGAANENRSTDSRRT